LKICDKTSIYALTGAIFSQDREKLLQGADALRYAALTYSWLSLGNKVNQLDYQHLTDNAVVKVGSPMRLAPIGVAAKQFMLAAAGMTEMQKINFDQNPVSVNGVFSLYGFKFKNEHGSSASDETTSTIVSLISKAFDAGKFNRLSLADAKKQGLVLETDLDPVYFAQVGKLIDLEFRPRHLFQALHGHNTLSVFQDFTDADRIDTGLPDTCQDIIFGVGIAADQKAAGTDEAQG